MSTATKVQDAPVGGLVHQIYAIDLTGSDTSINVASGLNRVIAAFFQNHTSEAQGLVHINYSDAGSTEKAGCVNLSGCTAADNGSLLVIGY